jgi:biopolymer transport protein ExbB
MSDLLRVVVGNGGFTVAVIAAVSVGALAVAIERAWRLLPLRRRFEATRAATVDAILRGDPPAPDQGDAMGRTLSAGLGARAQGAEAVRVVALDAAQREVAGIERGLGVLLVSAQVAPLLGLLGTVVGLIEAFHAAAKPGVTVTPGTLSEGLYKALGATVAGLWVAIPSYVAYGTLAGLAGRLIDQLEHAATALPALLQTRPPR